MATSATTQPSRGLYLMNRVFFLLCISLSTIAVGQPPAEEVDRSALTAKLAKVKVYDGDSVTMSPERDLLDGFRDWGKEGLQHLRGRLSDESRDVRHESLLLLAELPGGNDLLLEALKDKTCSVRGDILGMVGYVLRDERFIPAAGDLIHSEDKSLSIQAIGVTGRTHLLKVASDLLQIMKSDDETRSHAAAQALANMGIPDGAKIIVENARGTVDAPLWQGKVIDTLARSGSPDAVEYLMELFDDGMKMTKADEEPAGMVFSAAEHKELLNGKPRGAGIMLTGRSASAIASIGHRLAMPILQKGLKHPNKYVRSAAVQGLSAGDPTAGKALLEAIETAPKEQVGGILYAIAKTKDKSLVEEVRKLLDGPNRVDAITTLATLGDQSVVDTAIENSKATDMRTKQMGIIAVAALADDSDKARERVSELLNDPSARIQSSALSWVGAGGVDPAVESTILAWAKTQKNPNVIAMAARTLASVGGPKSMDYLQSLEKSESANVRYTAALARATISGEDQIFVRDSGEKVKVVLTSYYARSRRDRRLAAR